MGRHRGLSRQSREQQDGWLTARVNRPAGPIRVPTLPEMLRVKAWLVLRRNATRDYLDVGRSRPGC